MDNLLERLKDVCEVIDGVKDVAKMYKRWDRTGKVFENCNFVQFCGISITVLWNFNNCLPDFLQQGYLSVKDFSQMLCSLHMDHTQTDAMRLMAFFDKDSKGTVTKSEFMTGFFNRRAIMKKSKMQKRDNKPLSVTTLNRQGGRM